MERISIHDPNAIFLAQNVINHDGTIIYPTDTLYGLGVNATSKIAIEKLIRIKGREGPWSVIVSDFTMLERIAVVPEEHREFIGAKLPGKVSFILPLRQKNLLVTAKENKIGIRIPNHPFGRSLVSLIGYPITTTSMNRTGIEPSNDPNTLFDEFNDEIDLLIDEGTLPYSKGSTIYEFTDNVLTIIRHGDED